MLLEIDFESEEALYIQLRNQIIYGIATRQYKEGDELPSVRRMADEIGINMHTVNKAYALLRQEGLLRVDRRRGAVIAFDIDHIKAMEELRDNLIIDLARACCKGVSREEAHRIVDELFDDYE